MNVKRGEIYVCNIGEENRVGCEQKGHSRPVLIVSNNIGHMHSSICMCAVITTKEKHNLPTHYAIPDYIGMHEPSRALLEYVICIDTVRLTAKIGTLNNSSMAIVDKKLKIAFGLE